MNDTQRTTGITEREKTENELLREKTFMEAVFNSVPGILYLFDANGRLVRWNKRLQTDSGFSTEELTNRHILSWFEGDEKSMAAVIKGIQTTMEKGSGEAEADFQKKDGATIPMYFTGTRLIIDGEPYLTGIGIDLTERKRVEEEREKLQAQLLHAQKIESVGRLAGGVAHDFNNMLNVILGYAALALRSLPDDDPLRHTLEQIQQAAGRSAGLTHQLLAFARKQPVVPRVFDLNQTVEDMLEMLRRLIGENIDLVWRPDANPILLKMDSSQIDQILTNLCDNSRDAINSTGRIIIETDTVNLDESYCAERCPDCVAGEYALLTVSDDGDGMDPETVSRLFEPFFTTKEMGKGTGLGLATIYGIIRQNKGFINVYSQPGMGTSFRVYLPRYLDEPSMAGEETANPFARGHETILLVEDEPMLLDMIAAMLKLQGYRVLAAATPEEAVHLAREHAGGIHLLMTDVIMPEMNGRDLATQLLAFYPGLKLLFMSGYTADIIAHHGVLDEGVHFIQKPFSINGLAAKVRESLET